MRQNSFPRWLIAALALMFLVLVVGGNWFYSSQEQQLRKRADNELKAIAQLKVDQIAAWRAERLGDAAILSEQSFFIDGIARWMANPQAERSEEILAQLRALQEHYHYHDVLLVDTNGHVRLSLRQHFAPLHEDAAQALAAAWHDRQPLMTDLHLGPGDLPPHLDVIAPLFAIGELPAEPVGAIILQSDASQYLFPLIQSWPTPSSSAETLLVRRDGDSVLFLNTLRHQPDTALKLRIPLSETDVPAAQAVLGVEGVVQGRDYRGVEVLAALLAVPDSPWFVVAKVDKAEIFADWHFRSRLILGLILGALVTVGTAYAVVWQRNQKMYYQTLLQAEKAQQESETRYQTTLLSIGDGVIVTDAVGQVVLLNPVAEALTGWSQGEAVGKPLEEVFRIVNEETRQPAGNPVRRVVREGIIVGLANHTLLIAKDGREIPIADSGAPTYDADGALGGVVLVFRDQTEERTGQRALRESETYIRTILDNLPVGVAVNSVDPTVSFSYMNDNFVRYYRTTREALADPDAFWDAVYEDAEFREVIKKRVLEDVTSNDPERMHWEDVPITRKGAETTFISARNVPIYGKQLMLSTVWDTTERKQAEAALRESEERYRLLINQSPYAIGVHQEDTLVFANPAAVRLLGAQSADDLIGKSVSDIVHPDTWEAARDRMNRMLQGESGLYPSEDRYVRLDGSEVAVEVTAAPFTYGGRPAVQVIALDITERKRAEVALRQYAERLAAINRLDRVISSNLEIALIYDNFVRELLALVSLDRTSIVLMNEAGDQWQVTRMWTQYEPVITPGVWRPVQGSVMEWLVTHRIPFLENEIGEHENWAETPLLRQEGIRSRLLLPLIIQERVVGMLTAASRKPNAFSEEDQHILTAIADQLAIAVQNSRLYEQVQRHAAELEQHVIERTAELSDLYNNAPCGYHSLDGNGVFERVNDTELAWLGYTREEIIGKVRAPDLFTPTSVQSFEQNFPVFKERGWLNNLELDMVRKDGSILPVLLSATAVMDQEGRYLSSRSTIIDHTERKRAGEALQQRTAQLEAANKELEAFSYSVSHDLRAPVRAMDGFSRMVLQDYAALLPDEGKRQLKVVRDSAQQMGRLIDDLLAFSRLSRQSVQKRAVSPAQLARTVFEELSGERENRRVEIIIGDLPDCQADPALLKQVFVNLLSNALKFTRPREVAQIEVGILYSQGKPVYFVKDNGVGFDMRYADKLFGVFQRLHRSEEFEGTGVGLAIVQRIIHRHGGRVWAESQADQDTTFYFTVEGESIDE